jgi:hypothetical protein
VFRSIDSLFEGGTAAPHVVQRERAIFNLMVAAFLAYAALFIYRTSFVIDGERYFSLFDDAMVSMRYGRNLARGYGLVWNPGGEHVEGYTNLLWVLYLGLVHLLPVAASKTSLLVQITAAGLLALNLYYVRRIALVISNGSGSVALAAVALTASYLPINNWSLQGMEVGVLVLVTTACSWLAIRTIETRTFRRDLYVVLGISTFVRPDAVVPFAAFFVFMAVVDRVHWRRHLWWGGLVLVAACAAQTLFRLWYYGDLLPNTYYLKVTGVPLAIRLARGMYTLLKFIWQSNVVLFVLPFALALRRDSRIWLLLWILIVQLAYSVYVGGDAWEYWGGSNRYICIAMPGFFILLAYALDALTSALAMVIRSDGTPVSTGRQAPAWLSALAVGCAIVSINSIYGAGALAEALLIRTPLHAGNGGENQDDVEQALAIRGVTSADATIAVTRAGTIPYFSDRPGVDLLGKNDRFVAHEPARLPAGLANFRQFRPGHMKFDFAYSIGRQRPDVVVQLRRREELAKPFLQDYQAVRLNRTCVFLRRASPQVIWDRLPPPGCE